VDSGQQLQRGRNKKPTNKAAGLETQIIEFKGLITTTKSASQQTKIDHIARKFW